MITDSDKVQLKKAFSKLHECLSVIRSVVDTVEQEPLSEGHKLCEKLEFGVLAPLRKLRERYNMTDMY